MADAAPKKRGKYRGPAWYKKKVDWWYSNYPNQSRHLNPYEAAYQAALHHRALRGQAEAEAAAEASRKAERKSFRKELKRRLKQQFRNGDSPSFENDSAELKMWNKVKRKASSSARQARKSAKKSAKRARKQEAPFPEEVQQTKLDSDLNVTDGFNYMPDDEPSIDDAPPESPPMKLRSRSTARPSPRQIARESPVQEEEESDDDEGVVTSPRS
ncbi:hypothetical protein LTR56_004694 [Elasticomyces elasticus]|nr:hypothetical protein LTR56_004694 [Elasticomyces elasticus]KAK3665549.1 hypothetical protein LTR22_003489 [Elasticomyces elasticus]KAK4930413.1 hypothetical protein LTR49_003154 [Elasticomyces elasticus]KAK5768860.1 hypothetical protein LTS12_000920 [Elasticomyces elasticus]